MLRHQITGFPVHSGETIIVFFSGNICLSFHQLGPLGRVGLVVAISIYMSPPPLLIFLGLLLALISHDHCQASHWIIYIYIYYQKIVEGIGATIRIGRETWCLPYAGFLDCISSNILSKNKSLRRASLAFNHRNQCLYCDTSFVVGCQKASINLAKTW